MNGYLEDFFTLGNRPLHFTHVGSMGIAPQYSNDLVENQNSLVAENSETFGLLDYLALLI